MRYKVSKKRFFLSIACILFIFLGIAIPVSIASQQHTLLTEQATSLPSTPTRATPLTQSTQFQTGMAFPRWTANGYSYSDIGWVTGLQTMHTQIGNRWLEMPILFVQDTLTSTNVHTNQSTPTLTAFAEGVRIAHNDGYHVFVTPLITVNGSDAWAGDIHFSTSQQEQAWFASYLHTLQPYLKVAQQEQVEQLAIGTEEEWLQQYAPDSLWNTLIAHVHAVFTGTLSYDLNWTALTYPIPQWMHNPTLSLLGVSEYISLEEIPTYTQPPNLTTLWQITIKAALDDFAHQSGKPLLISEIGYRNSKDTLYHTWQQETNTLPDPAQQAAACDAALTSIPTDTAIHGIYFWGWHDVGRFSLAGQPATAIILKHYRTLV